MKTKTKNSEEEEAELSDVALPGAPRGSTVTSNGEPHSSLGTGSNGAVS